MVTAGIIRRVAAGYLHKEAGIQDWLKWFSQPFRVIWKHHKEFIQGPVDDAIDLIIKELAPQLVRAIGEKEVEEDLVDFTRGAEQGQYDKQRAYLASPPNDESDDFVAGYQWGYANADGFKDQLPTPVKRQVIEKALGVFRKTITEEVLGRMLSAIWHAINPKHTFDAIVQAVKKYGWKLGIGFALFEVFEHFALPALLMKLTGDPKMLAMASLPIGEVIYAVVFRILGRTPKEIDTPTEEGHLDWYEKNFGAIKLAYCEFPDFKRWSKNYYVYRAIRSKRASEPNPQSVSLVVAVNGNELLGAKDSTATGARDTGTWMLSGIDGPFELYLLKHVPLVVAEALVDFGTRVSKIRDGKKVWRLVKKYAKPQTPLKTVSVSF
jgi:hypothetical protein